MIGREQPRFLKSLSVSDRAPSGGYPFDIPAIAGLGELEFAPITVLVGENGSGKSTLIEAIAVAGGFNAEGGSRHLQFETMATHSTLGEYLDPRWRSRPMWGWFLRAETFYGMASHIAQDGGLGSSFPDLHARSHGESFLSLIEHRFGGPGLYLMDEPESALSFQGQLRLLRYMYDGLRDGAQFIIATHSPLLMRMPGALLYELSDRGIHECAYDDLTVVGLWRRFLDSPERLLDVLFSDEE